MIGGIGCHAMTNDLLGRDVAHNLGTVHASSTIEYLSPQSIFSKPELENPAGLCVTDWWDQAIGL